jgi:hypothetical protein
VLLPREVRAVLWAPRLSDALSRGGVLVGTGQDAASLAKVERFAAATFGLDALDPDSLEERGVSRDGELALAWLEDDSLVVVLELVRPEVFERAMRRRMFDGRAEVRIVDGFGARAYLGAETALVLRGRQAVLLGGRDAAVRAEALTRPGHGERLADEPAFAAALREAGEVVSEPRPSPTLSIYLSQSGAEWLLGLSETRWVEDRARYVASLETSHSSELLAAAGRLVSRAALDALEDAHRRRLGRVRSLEEASPSDRILAPLAGLFVSVDRPTPRSDSWGLRGVVIVNELVTPAPTLVDVLAMLGAPRDAADSSATFTLGLGRLFGEAARRSSWFNESESDGGQRSSEGSAAMARPVIVSRGATDATLAVELAEVQRRLTQLDDDEARRRREVEGRAEPAKVRARFVPSSRGGGHLEGELLLIGQGVWPALLPSMSPAAEDIVALTAARTRAVLVARRDALLDALYRVTEGDEGER